MIGALVFGIGSLALMATYEMIVGLLLSLVVIGAGLYMAFGVSTNCS